jgi:hypothetical protein
MVSRSRGCNSTEHFQYSGKCPVEKARRQQGLSAVHIAQCIVEDVAKGMDIWDCVAEICSRVLMRKLIPSQASRTFLDSRVFQPAMRAETGDTTGNMPIVSAGFVATGIDSLADIVDMQFSTPDCDGSTYDNLSVGVGVVGVTGSDMDRQDQEDLIFETVTETAGSQIDIANNVSPEESFRFGHS